MKRNHQTVADGIFMAVTLLATFAVNLLLQQLFNTQTMIPMIFVLGVFLVSWRTQGYFWGITASLLSASTCLPAGNGRSSMTPVRSMS